MSEAFDLDDLQVASPCKASWDGMVGTGSVRLCTLCRHNVYDVSGMTRAEAEDLFRERTGRTCVRLFRRADGTVMTSDCPRGLAAVRKRVAAVAAAVLGLLAAVGLGATVTQARSGNTAGAIWNVQPFRMMRDWFAPPPPPIMGIVCPPAPAPAPAPEDPPTAPDDA